MRKFRLKQDALGYTAYVAGETYNEDFKPSDRNVAPPSELISRYPQDWEEVFEEVFEEEKEKSSGWISVYDRTPDTTDNVLITDGSDVYIGYHLDFWYTSDTFMIEDITHWMPLPQLPKK